MHSVVCSLTKETFEAPKNPVDVLLLRPKCTAPPRFAMCILRLFAHTTVRHTTLLEHMLFTQNFKLMTDGLQNSITSQTKQTKHHRYQHLLGLLLIIINDHRMYQCNDELTKAETLAMLYTDQFLY